VRRGVDVGADKFDRIVAVEFVCARTDRPAATTSTTGRRDSRFSRSMNFVLLDTATGLPPKVRRCSRDPMERRLTSRCSTEPFSASYIRRSKILAAKSISTGCAPTMGNPALL
jgi:hypothetical protein